MSVGPLFPFLAFRRRRARAGDGIVLLRSLYIGVGGLEGEGKRERKNKVVSNLRTYNHYKRPVMPRCCYDDTGHVLIAPGNRDVRVVVLGTGHGLDAIGDEVTRLEGIPHSYI